MKKYIYKSIFASTMLAIITPAISASAISFTSISIDHGASGKIDHNGDGIDDCHMVLKVGLLRSVDDTASFTGGSTLDAGDYYTFDITDAFANEVGLPPNASSIVSANANPSSPYKYVPLQDFNATYYQHIGIVFIGGSTIAMPIQLKLKDVVAQSNQASDGFETIYNTLGFGISNTLYGNVGGCAEVTFGSPVNQPPIANAGPDQNNVGANTPAAITGVASTDLENQTLSYNWSQTSGSPVTWLTGSANSMARSFTMPADSFSNPVEFQLIVNDGVQNSTPDTIKLTAIRDVPVNTGGSTTIKHISGRPIKKTTVVRPRDLLRPTVVKPNTGGMKVTEPDGSNDAAPEKKKTLPPRR